MVNDKSLLMIVELQHRCASDILDDITAPSLVVKQNIVPQSTENDALLILYTLQPGQGYLRNSTGTYLSIAS
jgi:hypothetical protein